MFLKWWCWCLCEFDRVVVTLYLHECGFARNFEKDRQECKCSNEHVLSIIFPKLACWTCLKMATQSMYPPVNVYSLLLKNAIEIVDFPIKNGDWPIKNGGSFFPYSYVKKNPESMAMGSFDHLRVIFSRDFRHPSPLEIYIIYPISEHKMIKKSPNF